MLYLTSTEYERLAGPIQCEIVSNSRINKRQVLVIKIDPPFSGIDFGRGLHAVNYLILTAKYKDSQIKQLSDFPIEVIVFIPDNLDQPLNINRKWSDMQSIAWATLFGNIDEKHLQPEQKKILPSSGRNGSSKSEPDIFSL